MPVGTLTVAKTKKALPAPGLKSGDVVYQIKITLLGSNPPIWRRILVKDCTLDELHYHIQRAMGWTNSHLHQFKDGKKYYSDPRLMEESFFEMESEDSTVVKISDLFPERARRRRLKYEYDFGDSWEHEVLFERRIPAQKGVKYPLCVDGARACPPEDVGGVWGYADFIVAMQNPTNERHRELRNWYGREKFDPEAFDPNEATRRMAHRF